jgi:hypothetical protein
MLQLLLHSEERNSHWQVLPRWLRQPKQAELIKKRNRYASAYSASVLLRYSCKTKGITYYSNSPSRCGDISSGRILYNDFFSSVSSFEIFYSENAWFEFILVIHSRLNCYSARYWVRPISNVGFHIHHCLLWYLWKLNLSLRSSYSICKVVLSSSFRHSSFRKLFLRIWASVKIMEMEKYEVWVLLTHYWKQKYKATAAAKKNTCCCRRRCCEWTYGTAVV